jgi:hypothetical protein
MGVTLLSQPEATPNFMAAKRFVISDERVVNSYGIRVMTDGIDISQYERNNVCLYMHQRGRVIGKFIDLRKEGPVLTGEPVFDEKDELGAKIKQQVEDGFIRACSPELEPIEWSAEPFMMLPGQPLPTATKTKLYEISICDIPGNDGSLMCLSLPGGSLRLSHDPAATAEILKQNFPNLQLNHKPKMKLLLSRLGLSSDASEDAALAAIDKLKTDAKGETADFVLKLAKTAGLIKPEKEALFLRLAKLDPEAALELVDFSSLKPAGETVPPKDSLRLVNVVEGIREANAEGADASKTTKDPLDVLLLSRADWDARKWEKEDPANWLKLKKTKPEIHTGLYDAFYKAKG